MTYLAGILLAAYGVSVLTLGWYLRQATKIVREERAVKPAGEDLPRWPSLDILVPVKDEESHIAECLQSVLTQEYPEPRILVVNDRSQDGTARAVQSVQDQHAHVRRVDIPSLPDGLYGKPHAIHAVAGELSADVIAFVDSDLKLHPACLRTLVYHLESNDLDWVAVMGAPEIRRFWERLLIPIFGAVAFAWYDPRKISDPKWPDAIGSALMICRRRAYEAIGGHGAVIRVYDEDSELIRIAKRAGQKVSFVLSPELFTQRHYGDLASTIRGLTRTCIGGIKTLPRLLLTMHVLNFISLVPFGVLILLGVAAWLGAPILWTPIWLAAACLHLAISTALALVIFDTAGAAKRFALLHPLGAALMIGICTRAAVALKRGGPVTWRGTTY